MNLSKQYIFLLLVFITSVINTYSQTITDTIPNQESITDTLPISINDSLPVSDSVYIVHDSITNLSDSATYVYDSTYLPWDSVLFSLNGYLFNTTDSFIIEKWKYNADIHNFDFSEYDSTLREFHVTHPAFQKSINNNYLGNSGLAIQSNLFFEPNEETGYLFLRSFTPYMHQSKHQTYYNVQKPFTKFEYQTGPREEQNIGIIHTQNVNPYLNVFAKFNNYGSRGFYINQETKNNSGAIGGAHIRKRYSTHANFTFSSINVQENGGIIDPYFITDSIPLPSTTETGTRLIEGINYIKDRQWFIDQKIGFVKSRKTDTSSRGAYLFSIQYNYHHQKSFRIYEDKDEAYFNPITNEYQTMYLNNYSGANTFDTSSFTTHEHLFRINLEESPGNWMGFGAYIGAGKHYSRYFYYNKDTVFVNSLDKKIESSFFEGGIFRLRPSHLNFFAHYRYFINGYRQNDVALDGQITIKAGKNLFASELTAEAKTESKSPDYFLTNYRSNHFRWNNNFNKVNITELKGKYELTKLNTTIGARYALLTNYIYFNQNGVPNQFNSNFNVFDAYLDNILSAYNFNLITRINYQQSGKPDLLPVPDWSFYNALYFEYPVVFPSTQGHMKLQLGVDWYYWTEFYAQLYSPATAQFHAQNSQKIGNYPFIGAFLNIEIKRMRIYIKGEHVNYSYMKDKNLSNFFMSPNYPTPRAVVKYGLTWTFYD